MYAGKSVDTTKDKWQQISHESTCISEKPHKWEYCEKSFAWKVQPTVYKRMHTYSRNAIYAVGAERTRTGEKPHKSRYCERAKLTIHERTHTREM